ncbi:MAG: hypothetical protein ACJ74U_03580 [Jatrophihabitantaceae bacterium]
MALTIIGEYLGEMTDEDLALFSRSLADAAAQSASLAIDPEGVDLVATGDFVQSVRDRFDNQAEAAAYTTDRGAGIVAARTMPNTATGRVAVIIPAGFMLLQDEGGAELRRRTVTHELAHVAIYQAGEASTGCRQRLAGGTIAQADFVAIAGIAVEEFRAELAVHEAGWDDEDNDISADVEAAHSAWRSAAEMVCASDFCGALATAFQALNVLCQRLAYVTASLVHQTGRDELRAHRDESYVEVFMRALLDVPSGNERIDRGQIDVAIAHIAEAVRGFLLEVGFDYRDTPGPGAWFGFTGAYDGD